MKNFLVTMAVLVVVLMPVVSFAWVPGSSNDPLIPCGVTGPDCTFADLVKLGSNIVDALFFFSIPLVAIVFAIAGTKYLTAMGNPSAVSGAKKMFTSVLMGFLFMLSAWLIVKFIASTLLTDEFRDTPVKLE